MQKPRYLYGQRGFCEDLNLQRGYVIKIAEDLFEKLPGSLDKAILSCNAKDPKSQSFIDKLQIYVMSNSRKLMKRIAWIFSSRTRRDYSDLDRWFCTMVQFQNEKIAP